MSELLSVRISDARPPAGFRPTWLGLRSEIVTPEPFPEPAGDPFGEGYRQGFAEAELARSEERKRMTALLAACEALQAEPSEELALLIAETVDGLVRLTVGEVEIDARLLLERCRRAAAIIAVADGARTLRLHPEDLALLEQAALPITAISDPGLARGSLRIEDSAGWVEDGVSVHLDALREQLGLDGAAR